MDTATGRSTHWPRPLRHSASAGEGPMPLTRPRTACTTVAASKLLAVALLKGGATAQDSRPAASAPSAPTHSQAEAKPWAGYDGEFFLRSADDRYRLSIGGLLQVQGRAYQAERGRTSDFFLERMRLEIGGTIERIYHFNLEPKFTEEDVELEEAWVGADLGRHALLMLGRMKEPFSLEEMLP